MTMLKFPSKYTTLISLDAKPNDDLMPPNQRIGLANCVGGVYLSFQPSPQPACHHPNAHQPLTAPPFVFHNLSAPSTLGTPKSNMFVVRWRSPHGLARAHGSDCGGSAFHSCLNVIPLARCLRFETKRGRQTSATFQVNMRAYPCLERGFDISRKNPLRNGLGC